MTTYLGKSYEVVAQFIGQNTGQTTQTTKKHIFLGSTRICTIRTTQDAQRTTNYYHTDHLGSSNIITDETGTKTNLYEYTPYGETWRSEGSTEITHKFTGKELDNTGLYFYGARYYDPQIGRFITADTIIQAPYDPQSLNRYSYCRNNPVNLVDPTGHWSWKKFCNSFAGAFIGALIAGILTGGFGFGLMAAGFWGGMVGGAVTGGLEGGWRGALIGAGIGGALGGLGGWGIGAFGASFGYGMLAAGAGYAGATDSWDSFAGGIGGGIAGYATGSEIGSSWKKFTGSGQQGINRNDLAAQTEQLKQSQQALDVKPDERIRIGSRDAIGPADHMFIERENGMFVEAGAGNDGKMTVFQYNPKDYINPASRVNLAPTQKHTLSAFYEGKLHLQWSDYTTVSSAKLNNLISGYQNIWSNAVYAAGSNNSNNFVNTCVYGSGGYITGLNTLRPSFSTYRDDR